MMEMIDFCDIYLSVSHMPHIPYVYLVLERRRKLIFYGGLLLTIVNSEVIQR